MQSHRPATTIDSCRSFVYVLQWYHMNGDTIGCGFIHTVYPYVYRGLIYLSIRWYQSLCLYGGGLEAGGDPQVLLQLTITYYLMVIACKEFVGCIQYTET